MLRAHDTPKHIGNCLYAAAYICSHELASLTCRVLQPGAHRAAACPIHAHDAIWTTVAVLVQDARACWSNLAVVAPVALCAHADPVLAHALRSMTLDAAQCMLGQQRLPTAYNSLLRSSRAAWLAD